MVGIIVSSVMHDFIIDRVPLPQASEYYAHPYGGIARDIWVTREGFARLFGHSLEYVDSLHCNMKVFDDMQVMCETLGYKQQYKIDGPITYRVIFIDHSSKARIRFHQQEVDKLNAAFERAGDAAKKVAEG